MTEHYHFITKSAFFEGVHSQDVKRNVVTAKQYMFED